MASQKPFQTIDYPSTSATKKIVIVTYLTKEEEDTLDEVGLLTIKRGKLTFEIEKKDVYCYGEIDFNKGSDDYEMLAEQRWFDDCTMLAVTVPSDYDYENNVIESDIKGGRWYDTTRVEVVSQFYHGRLGKPKRTIIFKHYV